MILHRDELLELKYAAPTDILTVRWLNSKQASRAELEYSFTKLLETIRSYDIKRLLMDAREDVTAVTDEEYVELNMGFAQNLAATPLKKIARLGTVNINRENFVETLAGDVLAQPATVLTYQNFSSEQKALQWLVAE